MQDPRFASEEAKLIRTLGLLQLVLLASTLAVVLARAGAESAMEAYERKALALILSEAAPEGFTVTIADDATPGHGTGQRIRLEQVSPGQFSLRKAALLLAGNARHHGLVNEHRRVFRFEVHDKALGITLQYIASPSVEDIPLRNAPQEPVPPLDAHCPHRTDVKMAVVGPDGRIDRLLPVTDRPQRLLFHATLDPALEARRPDLAKLLALSGTALFETRAIKHMASQLMTRSGQENDPSLIAYRNSFDPCRTADTFALEEQAASAGRSSVTELSRALGVWKPTLEDLNAEYERMRDSRLNEAVKIPVLDVTVPAVGFAWAVIGLALYIGVTLSRLARSLAQEDHRVVTAVAQLWPTKKPPAGRADQVAFSLERMLPWLNAFAVALTPVLVAVASATLWGPLQQSHQIVSSERGMSTVTFLPIRYLVPYLVLLGLAALVSWSSCRALWREWRQPEPADQATSPEPGFLGGLRLALESWTPTIQLKLLLLLAGAAAIYYGDLLLGQYLGAEGPSATVPPLLIPKVLLASAVTMAALAGLTRPHLQRTMLALVATALIAAYGTGATMGIQLALSGRPPLWTGPIDTELVWVFGTLTAIGAYGAWLLMRLRGWPTGGTAGTRAWRWVSATVVASLMLEAWMFVSMQS